MQYPIEFAVELVCALILAGAFAYGAKRLFRKGKPLYFQLYVLACGCRMLGHFINAVLLFCDLWDGSFTATRFFGNLACSLFILSANRGTLDGIVDDRRDKRNAKARYLALFAPFLMLALLLAASLSYYENISRPASVFLFISAFPTVPASYFNLKHLLLPIDDFELLKATKGCNICALVLQVLSLVYSIASVYFSGNAIVCACEVLVYIPAIFMVAAAVKGVKR